MLFFYCDFTLFLASDNSNPQFPAFLAFALLAMALCLRKNFFGAIWYLRNLRLKRDLKLASFFVLGSKKSVSRAFFCTRTFCSDRTLLPQFLIFLFADLEVKKLGNVLSKKELSRSVLLNSTKALHFNNSLVLFQPNKMAANGDSHQNGFYDDKPLLELYVKVRLSCFLALTIVKVL